MSCSSTPTFDSFLLPNKCDVSTTYPTSPDIHESAVWLETSTGRQPLLSTVANFLPNPRRCRSRYKNETAYWQGWIRVFAMGNSDEWGVSMGGRVPPARHSWDRRSLCAVRLCTSTGRGTYRDKSYIPASQCRRSWSWSLGHDGGLWSSCGETQENPRRRLTNLPQRVKRSCLDAPDSPVISQFKCDGSTSRHILQTSPSKDNINTPIRRRHSNITSARRTTKHLYFIILHSYTQLYSINCTAS